MYNDISWKIRPCGISVVNCIKCTQDNELIFSYESMVIRVALKSHVFITNGNLIGFQSKRMMSNKLATRIVEFKIPVPWGYIAGK